MTADRMADPEYSDSIRRAVDAAPPLSADQRHRLAVLLRSSVPVGPLATVHEISRESAGTVETEKAA